MRKYWNQIQLIGLWVIALALAVIATTQIIQIYQSYKDRKQEAAAFKAPPPPPPAPAVDPKLPVTTIVFADTTHDFGTIKEGDSVVYSYKFKNTGQNPLTIVQAFGSCGCTVPYWPKKPVMTGQGDEVKVVFHSKGKQGFQEKVVTVIANTNPQNSHLKFKVNVLPLKKDDKK